MKLRTPDYYDSFACIADRCPDTCCQGWAIVVDEESYVNFQSIPGPIGERLRSALQDQDGEHILTCRPDGRCRMLDDDGLCSLQRACGEGALCQVCDRFPRFVTQVGLNQEWGLSLSCPEAARLILTRQEPVTFVRSENDDRTIVCHDVDPDFYFNLKQARDRVISLLQDRTLPLPRRVLGLALLADRLQRTRRRFCPRSMEQVLSNGLPTGKNDFGPGTLAQRRWLLRWLLERPSRRADWHPRLKQALDALDALEASAYTAELSAEFARYCENFDGLQEQFLVYYVNKYLIRACFDGDILGALRYSMASWACVRTLAYAQWVQGVDPAQDRWDTVTPPDWLTICQQYAAETENDEAGCAALFEALGKRSRRQMRRLLSIDGL